MSWQTFRSVVVTTLAIGAALSAALSQAQSYPVKPIKVLVGFYRRWCG